MSYIAYLKIDGIDGDCSDAAHRGWMLLDSFNQNVCGPQERGGRTTLSEFALTKLSDASTPQLARATAEGRHFQEAVVELCLIGDTKQKFMEIRMTNARILSYGLSGSPQSDARTPYENMMIQFEKVEWLYFPNAFAPDPPKEPVVCRADWSSDPLPALQ